MPIAKDSVDQAKFTPVQATFKDHKTLKLPKDLKVVTLRDPKADTLRVLKVDIQALKLGMQGQGTPIGKPRATLKATASSMETGLRQKPSTLMS